MDLHQIENIVAIWQEGSISGAAEKLFLTQSALNQQLLKLEAELGLALFERRNRKMIPTPAGKVYLDTAGKMLDMKRKTYKILHDISDEAAGEIALAYTPESGSRMFSKVYPLFRNIYPDVTFRIHESRVKEMEKLILQKVVTFAFTTYYEFSRRPELEYMDISPEYMVLGVPISHPLARLAGENSWERLPVADLSLFREDSFVLLSRETRMRDMIDLAFSQAGFSPRILFESISTHTAVSMVEEQIAPALFPQSYAKPSDTMVFFTVPSRLKWMRCAAFLRDAYLSRAEKFFIALAADHTRGQLP